MRLNNLMFLALALTMLSIQQGLPALTGIGIGLFLLTSWIVWGYMWAVGMATIETFQFIKDQQKDLRLPAKQIIIRESIEGYHDKPARHILEARSAEFEKLFMSMSKVLKGNGKHFEVSSTFDSTHPNIITHTIQAFTPEAQEALTDLKNRLLLSGKSDISFS